MTATAAQVAILRRMTAEPTEAIYTDESLADYIEKYPLLDERGEQPHTWDTSTEPPTKDTNDNWIATYDLNAAAADVWEEKAAAVASLFDFSADGGKYDRSQQYEQYMKNARNYRSRRASKTMTSVKWPDEIGVYPAPWIINDPEVD